MEKKKTTPAHIRATKKWEDKAYFKTLVRFKQEDEAEIREAAGDSLNGFITSAVLDAVKRKNADSQNAQDPKSQNAPDRENAKAETQNAPDAETQKPKSENAKSQNAKSQNAQVSENAQDPGLKTMTAYAIPTELVEEMKKYGEPATIILDGVLLILQEYRAGLR